MSATLSDIKAWFAPRTSRDLLRSSGSIEKRLNKLAFNWEVRSGLYRHLVVQVNNDIDQVTALESYVKRLQRRRKHGSAKIVKDVAQQVRDGNGLPKAFSRWVPPDELLTIRGGDDAGDVVRAFEQIIESKSRVGNVKRTMRSAFATPVVYLLAIYAVLWIIGKYFLPSLKGTLPLHSVTGMGKLLVILGTMATSLWSVVPVVLIVGGSGWLAWALPNWTGPYRRHVENIFPFNFYRDIMGYTWLLTFAGMLQAGIPDVKILEQQARSGSPWLRQRLLAVQRRLINGMSFADALLATNYGFPNPDLVDDIATMHGFKDFSTRIRKRAIEWADELEETTKVRVRVLGIVFNIAMYAIMGVVLIGINSLSVQIGNVPGLQ